MKARRCRDRNAPTAQARPDAATAKGCGEVIPRASTIRALPGGTAQHSATASKRFKATTQPWAPQWSRGARPSLGHRKQRSLSLSAWTAANRDPSGRSTSSPCDGAMPSRSCVPPDRTSLRRSPYQPMPQPSALTIVSRLARARATRAISDAFGLDEQPVEEAVPSVDQAGADIRRRETGEDVQRLTSKRLSKVSRDSVQRQAASRRAGSSAPSAKSSAAPTWIAVESKPGHGQASGIEQQADLGAAEDDTESAPALHTTADHLHQHRVARGVAHHALAELVEDHVVDERVRSSARRAPSRSTPDGARSSARRRSRAPSCSGWRAAAAGGGRRPRSVRPVSAMMSIERHARGDRSTASDTRCMVLVQISTHSAPAPARPAPALSRAWRQPRPIARPSAGRRPSRSRASGAGRRRRMQGAAACTHAARSAGGSRPAVLSHDMPPMRPMVFMGALLR